jgi:hypothetical protein
LPQLRDLYDRQDDAATLTDMVGSQVAVAVARRRAEPGDLCAAMRIARAAGRRPDLRDERTVPGQRDLSCIAGRLMV